MNWTAIQRVNIVPFGMVNAPRVPVRLPAHNYGGAGWYFITTCTANRRQLLARTVGEELVLTRAGQIVAEVWARTPLVDYGLSLDVSVVMPDHFHGIVIIQCSGTRKPTRTLSTLVGTFKSISSREIHREILNADRIWQRGFHDRVIRSDRELLRIQEYIRLNPARWLAQQRSL